MMTTVTPRRALLLLTCTGGLGLAPSGAAGQGCEPIRFTVPVNLGAAGQVYKPSGWEITLAYRRLFSNQYFVGTEENTAKAPLGTSPVIKIHTVVADVAYAFNDRVRARVSLPFSAGTLDRKWPDNVIHGQTASGLGDISVMGEAWLLKPLSHPNGNVAIALGVKAPTGSHTKPGKVYLASGAAVDFPADQVIQPGDGGWAALMDLQAFRQVVDRVSLYALGSYMASPKARSDVTPSPTGPTATIHWSVPDVYSARTGAAFEALPERGVSVSFGARVDGIPVHDLFGGGDDDTIKRTSYVVYADPGISYAGQRNTVTLSVPWRVKVNRMKSLLEQQPGSPVINGGGFASYLVFASYSRRF